MASVLFTIKSNTLTDDYIKASALKYGLSIDMSKREVFSLNKPLIDAWLTLFKKKDVIFDYSLISIEPRKVLFSGNSSYTTKLNARAIPTSYTAVQIARIYKIPTPVNTAVTLGVISFGGGLTGDISASGVLTNGDVQTYWTSIGINPADHPKVIVKPINGATNNLTDTGSTAENTLDVETIGGCCPSSKLTIIIYLSPNSLQDIYNAFNYIINTPVLVDTISYKPSIISCSWGLPETYVPNSLLNQLNTLLSSATANGMNICTATGDNGSNNGVGGSGSYADFPSSCPYVTSVGGTSLFCPSLTYDTSTVETAWSSGGGAVSAYYSKPTYQNTITASRRSIPDLALVADPNTGVQFLIYGQQQVYGGTSVAAPVFAGFLAAINAKTFINSIIYTRKTDFNDIISGSNGAFSAKAGYDTCTGLGSLKGDLLGVSIRLGAPILASGLTFNTNTISLLTTQTYTIVATVLPADATNKTLTWTTSNNTNVSVLNGLITAKAATNTPVIITAITNDGSNISATANITVSTKIAVTNVSLNQTTAILPISQTLQLTATILPTNASIKGVTWSTNNAHVTVNSSGLVTAGTTVGTSIVKVTTADGAKSTSCAVTIVIPVSSVSVNPTSLLIKARQKSQITATIVPLNATNKILTWATSDRTIATVNSSGLVTAIKIGGPVSINCRTSDGGFTASTTVTVN